LVAVWSAISLLAAGCGAGQPPAALVVDDVAYSETELGALTESQRGDLATLSAFGLLVARGELPRVAEPFLERERQSRILRKLSREIAAREAGFDQERLQAAYDAAPEYELLVRHLVILSEHWRADEQRAAARGRAAEALRKIQGGASFAAIAGEYSEEPGADRRGGLLEPGRRGTWVSEFWEAASALEPGAVSPVIETPYGYHVLRLEERHVIPLDEVRDQVLGRLVDLSAAAPAADAWAELQAEQLQVREEAVIGWRDGAAPDDIVLASWPGGAYHGADLRRYLLTLEQGAGARLAAAERVAYQEVVRALGRNALLAQRAGELGIGLSEAELTELEGPGVLRFQELAAALGYRRGAAPAQVKAMALRALGNGGQRVLIARTDLLGLAPAIEHHYPARFPGSAGAPPSPAFGR
jgi:hypothetical protein